MSLVRALLVLVWSGGLLLGSASPAAADTAAAPLDLAIAGALASFSGTAAVVVSDPTTGVSYRTASAQIFPSASLYKLMVLVEAYRQASAGSLSLDDQTITISDDDLADGGVETDSGTALTVRDALERMITVSDNSCARALVRLLDTHNVNATARSLGLADTRINTTLPEEERTADYNTTSAADLERLFDGLVQGTIVNAAASRSMLDVLARQQINDRLPAGLPDGTRIAHKTGNLDGIAHDAGVITTPFGPRVVVVLTEDYADYADVITLAAAVAHDAFTIPLDRFAAAVAAQAIPSVTPGHPYRTMVHVTNTSTFAWDATFHLAEHWRDETGRYVRWDGARAPLPPLAPGQTAVVEFSGVAPSSTAPFGVLELDVVHEGYAWAGTPARLVIMFGTAAQ